MIAFRKSLKDLTQYPSAIAGMIMIVGFLVVSVYAMTSIPYNEAIRLWRRKQALRSTYARRPDLIRDRSLSREDQRLLSEIISEGVVSTPV